MDCGLVSALLDLLRFRQLQLLRGPLDGDERGYLHDVKLSKGIHEESHRRPLSKRPFKVVFL